MSTEEIATKLIEYFDLERVSDKKISMYKKGSTSRKSFIEDIVESKDFFKETGLVDFAMSTTTSELPKVIDRALDRARYLIKEAYKQSQKADQGESASFLAKDINPDDFILFADKKNMDNYLVYSREPFEKVDLDYRYILKNMHKDDRDDYLRSATLSTFSYEPYSLESSRISVDSCIPYTIVNTYTPPEWRKLEPSTEPPEVPDLMRRFFEHLFPNPECREYVYSWIYYMLVDKNQTILLLNGPKGAGKNFFVGILHVLVGRKNYKDVGVESLTNNFNSSFAASRLQFIDELSITGKVHQNLKKYMNDMQAIERKGQDVGDPERTYNSWVAASNDRKDVYIEWDDRRFSPVEIAQVKTDKVFTREEGDTIANYLKKYLTDGEISQDVVDFGHWILNRGPKDVANDDHWEGESFHSIVYTSLTAHKQFIIETLLAGNRQGGDNHKLSKITSDFKKLVGGAVHKPATLKRWLETFRLGGEIPIATLGSDSTQGKSAEIVAHPRLREVASKIGIYEELEIEL